MSECLSRLSVLAARRTLALAVVLTTAGCGLIEPNVPGSLGVVTPPPARGDAAASENSANSLRIDSGPRPPQLPASAAALPPASTVPVGGDAVAAVNLQQVALPTFIQIVYTEILKKSVNLDPAVTARQDLVTFRTGGGQTATEIEKAVRLLLKSYGLSAVDVGGLVRVVPDNAALGDLPTIRYGSATPDVPLPLRPVFNLVQLSSVRQTDVANWLRTMFGDRITVQEDAGRNAVLLRGNPDNVKAALEALAVLDQPAMKGRASQALVPAFWSCDELAKRLSDVLASEGYAVAPVGQPIMPGASRFPIILLPVSALNTIYVFASSDAVAAHVADWARTLDKPTERGIGKNYFIYAVKHKDAELLAETLDRILTGSRTSSTSSSTASAAAAVPATAGATAATDSPKLNSVVVDKSTNTLIFQVKAEEYGQIMSLLQTLDRPSKSAMIEVTVAELSLDDSNQLGVQWLASQVQGNHTYTADTAGGAALGTAGINFKVFNSLGMLRAAVNALATNNRATILSSPRLMARNGETATIQVGQQVPVITSQQSTGTVSPNNTLGILQQVQYRDTGVILKIKPVIHSGDQIDLDVSQEVSDAGKTDTGVSISPTFNTRKIDTKLTLANGATVALGGLISESGSQGNSGVPFLKDIPLIGSLFSTQSKSGERRELIILITPYIANDTHDAETITEAFRKQLGPWANRAGENAGAPLPMPSASQPKP